MHRQRLFSPIRLTGDRRGVFHCFASSLGVMTPTTTNLPPSPFSVGSCARLSLPRQRQLTQHDNPSKRNLHGRKLPPYCPHCHNSPKSKVCAHTKAENTDPLILRGTGKSFEQRLEQLCFVKACSTDEHIIKWCGRCFHGLCFLNNSSQSHPKLKRDGDDVC